MATIAENIQTIATATADIKDAILEKGGTITGDITTYGDAIRGIGGGVKVVEPWREVNFVDYDGTVVKSFSAGEFLNLKESDIDAIKPPEHNNLRFLTWNLENLDIQGHVNNFRTLLVGALYTTIDECTHAYIRISSDGERNITINFTQSQANGVIVKWGDGSGETSEKTGAVALTHKYPSVGEYDLSMQVTSGTFQIGRGTAASAFVTGTAVQCAMLREIHIDRRANVSAYAFANCIGLERVAHINQFRPNTFMNCKSLQAIVTVASGIGATVFSGCTALKVAALSYNTTVEGVNLFYGCTNLQYCVVPYDTVVYGYTYNGCPVNSIAIPPTISTINDYAFNLADISYYDFSAHTEVPVLRSYSTSVASFPSYCRFVVPDNLYNAWIAATNWSNIKSNIIKKSDFMAQNA